MKRFSLSIVIVALSAVFGFGLPPYVLILGIGQDAGVPQMGCHTPFCRRAWRDPKLRQMVASIALVDPETKSRWIFDATPDLPEQFEMLKLATGDRSNNIAGIFLTHAHIGHYTGLMYLGREAMNAKGVAVYAMPRMTEMLRSNAPWSQLVDLENISLLRLTNNSEVKISPGLTVQPFTVPHRDEFSETVGYRITSGAKKLIYIPDIDKWQKWDSSLADVVRSSDHLLIDGTFFADGEINRPSSEVPHPFVTETMDLLDELPTNEKAKVIFIHFNHSNPLVMGDRKKINAVMKRGFRIASVGNRIELR